ncbi:MAG: tetratricopeptide repeat protein [Planctomycetota bacterium]|jgi:tetratricopeptide (TPR) repeat protein
MNRLGISVLVAALLVVCCQAALLAEDAAVEPRDALVMVLMRSFMGRQAGNGFVVGDGTLVVTAHHLVFGESGQGRHQMAGLVSVVSPYIGDGCEAKIVAADEELDLAVLRVPLLGHPALKLADERDILSAEQLVVLGIPDIARSLGSGTREPLRGDLDGRSENLPVDYIAVRQRTPRFISLAETGQLGEGWSGSPMLLPDSAVVAGCFTALNKTKGDRRVRARGPAVVQVRRLLKDSDVAESLKAGDTRLPRPKDAVDAFLIFARAYRRYLEHRHVWASERIEQLIRMRPESPFAYLMSASNAEVQRDFDLADQHFRKALALNPESAAARFFYAQSLAERRPDEALEMLESLWERDAHKPPAALLMFNILAERGQFQRAGELLTEALKLNPRNAYVLMSLGSCQYSMDRIDEAIASYTKAVELLPERGPFRGQIAHILEKADRLDEAEKHFRELLNIEPDNPVVHLWLARFLAKHRPEARDEALKEAQIALELPPRKGLPKEKIEQLIQELQSQTAPDR